MGVKVRLQPKTKLEKVQPNLKIKLWKDVPRGHFLWIPMTDRLATDVWLRSNYALRAAITAWYNILHLKSSKRVSILAEIQLITSGLYLLPINEENLALKKRRLPEAPLRSILQKEKILLGKTLPGQKKGLKLPNLIFVDEHSTCFTGNYLLHFVSFCLLSSNLYIDKIGTFSPYY
ncbi:hypothetical protein Avbf_13722 [Armadillidium vulgare]|nr:hypothetical protein Avbf_13722 [Armadillidium vulgare]